MNDVGDRGPMEEPEIYSRVSGELGCAVEDPEEVALKQDTSDGGQVTIGVQGQQQKRDYPTTAAEVKKSFSIEVESTPEPVGASSAGKTFMDSILCVAAPALGCADAVADVLKTAKWDLGVYSFPLIDWSAGWIVDQEVAASASSAPAVRASAGRG